MVDRQVRGVSFLNPLTRCNADHVANTQKIITIPNCLTLNVRMIDICVRIGHSDKIPVHIRPHVRNAIASALVKDLPDTQVIQSSVCDSRLRYMISHTPNDDELIRIQKTIKSSVRALLKPLSTTHDGTTVYNHAMLSNYLQYFRRNLCVTEK